MPGTQAQHEAVTWAQYIGTTELITADGSVHLSSMLVAGGRYVLMCPDTDVYVRQGGAGLSVDANQPRLGQGDMFFINVDDITNNRLAVMTATGVGGTVRLTRVDSVAGLATGVVATHKSQYFVSYLGPTYLVVVDNTVHLSALLPHGRYVLSCLDTDVLLRQGGNAVTVDNNQFILPMGDGFYFTVDDTTSDHIAVTRAALANGTLRITRVDSI